MFDVDATMFPHIPLISYYCTFLSHIKALDSFFLFSRVYSVRCEFFPKLTHTHWMCADFLVAKHFVCLK